jgi:hypothetical protein
MPVLAAFIDTQDVNILLYISETEFYLYKFPYVYSSNIFSSSYSETEFYGAVFDYYCKQHKLKLTDCDILVTGFLEPPKLNFNLKMYISLSEVMKGIKGFFPIYVNNYSVISPQAFFCSTDVKGTQLYGDIADPEELNFYANLSLYPQLVANDLATQMVMTVILFR